MTTAWVVLLTLGPVLPPPSLPGLRTPFLRCLRATWEALVLLFSSAPSDEVMFVSCVPRASFHSVPS